MGLWGGPHKQPGVWAKEASCPEVGVLWPGSKQHLLKDLTGCMMQLCNKHSLIFAHVEMAC